MFWSLPSSKKLNEGFILIELLVVVVLLGALSAVTALSVGGLTERSKAAACKANLATVNFAGQAYVAETGTVAATLDALIAGGYLKSKPANVAYTVNGDTFTALGAAACG